MILSGKLGRINALTLSSLVIHEYLMSLHLYKSSLVSYIEVLSFPAYVCLLNLYLSTVFSGATVNDSVFLISNSSHSLLVYMKAVDL